MSEDRDAGFLRLGLLVALAIVVIDQLTKWWIVFDVMASPRTIAVFPSFNLV
ncbi:MAG: signal peptidase II, partial [Rhodospirillales bacterium]|nr:signal peptidase II [Rhodospirillales bacterium]